MFWLKTGRRQYAPPQFRRRSGKRRRAAQDRADFPCPLHSRHADLASAIQVLADFAPLRLLGNADRVQLVLVAEFFAGHAVTTAPSSSRKFFRAVRTHVRSEEHTSELQSRSDLVCRLLL